jgi:hypothetical protein
MKKIYFDNWKTEADMLDDFKITKDKVKGFKVIFAVYAYGSYCGDAYVLLRKDKKYFVVEGSHCSCYGLEGQWNAVETALGAFRKEKADRENWGLEARYRFKELQVLLKEAK